MRDTQYGERPGGGYPSVPLLAAERTGARSGFGFVLNALHSFVASVRALSCLCPVCVDQA